MAEQLGEISRSGSLEFHDSKDRRCSLSPDGTLIRLARNLPGDIAIHFDRSRAKALIGHLRGWLDTGRLSPNPDISPADEVFAARITAEIVKRIKSPLFENLVRDAAESRDWLHIPSALDRLKKRLNEADGQEIGGSGGWHFRSMRRPEALFLKVSSEHEPFSFSTMPLSLVAALLSLLSMDDPEPADGPGPVPHPMAGWGRWAKDAEGFWRKTCAKADRSKEPRIPPRKDRGGYAPELERGTIS